MTLQRLPSTRTLTVLVHGKAGKDQLVLPNRGMVYLIYGDAKIPEQINNEGEATFKQIPATFFEAENGVEILFQDPEGEPYRSVRPDSLHRISPGQYVSLVVELTGIDAVQGYVKDHKTGKVIGGATIYIMGESTTSDETGYFLLSLPPEKQQKFHTIRASKEGYEDHTKSNTLIDRREEIVIHLKPD